MADIIQRAQEAGEFVTGDDGFVVYWPRLTGAYTPYVLRLIADELDKRNAAWQADIDAYFARQENDDGR